MYALSCIKFLRGIDNNVRKKISDQIGFPLEWKAGLEKKMVRRKEEGGKSLKKATPKYRKRCRNTREYLVCNHNHNVVGTRAIVFFEMERGFKVQTLPPCRLYFCLDTVGENPRGYGVLIRPSY